MVDMTVLPVIPLTPLLDFLDLLGVGLFALSGALLAAKERQTFVTMAFFALVTGVGGGSIRDLLIGAPIFWIADPWIAPVCLGVALLAWFTPTRWYDGKLLDYADGLGLTAYAVLGSAKALSYGIPPVPAFLMGIITGCVGGIIRDVIAGRPSIIMRPELYVTAAALSSALGVAGSYLDGPRLLIWAVATVAGYLLRSAAIKYNWSLPAYRDDRELALSQLRKKPQAPADTSEGTTPAQPPPSPLSETQPSKSGERDAE